MHTPGVLCTNHGPFTWGKDAAEAVHNAVVLEEVASMAIRTELLNPQVQPAPDSIRDKHFLENMEKMHTMVNSMMRGIAVEFALKQGRVLVLDAAEAKERWESASFWNEMEYMLQSNRMHFSKAVVLADAVVGEIMWHPEEAYDGRAVSIIYYLDRSELVLIGQKTRHDHWEKQLRSLISDEDDLSPVRFLSAFG